MQIPCVKCDLCGHIFSLVVKEGHDQNGKQERWFGMDPQHICAGGYTVRLDIPLVVAEAEGVVLD